MTVGKISWAAAKLYSFLCAVCHQEYLHQEHSPRALPPDDLDLDGETLSDLELSSGGKETFVLEVIVCPDESRGYYPLVIVMPLPLHRFLVCTLHPAVLI